MGRWKYAIVLDAGSSGTRAHVYRWPKKGRKGAGSEDLERLPHIETTKEWTKKIKPGVSSFSKAPENVGPDHLHKLLQHVRSIIPRNEVEDTPIFLLATAGMRLLPENEQNEILKNICSYISDNSGFLLPDCGAHIKVIDGKTEGLYGWIATNYLLGGFDEPKAHDHGKGHHTYGFLDMGGASAQLAFAPNSTEAEKHANDLTLLRLRKLNGQSTEYNVFVTSWLGFGVREARTRYVKALLEGSPADVVNRQHPDPCLPEGLRATLEGAVLPPDGPVAGTDPYLVGNGKFEQCLHETIPLLAKDVPCEDEPCLLNGVHVPAIDFDVNHFVGISEYWHTTHEIFEMGHQDKAYDFKTYQMRVNEFCSTPWSVIKDGIEQKKWGKVDQETAYEVCFKAAWIINILHDGIGIPRVGSGSTTNNTNSATEELAEHGKHGHKNSYIDPFQAVNKINATEVSWTLGKAVLYASSQVPPAKGSLPVGFGSNVPGKIPDDFEYPSSNQPHIPSQPSSGKNGTSEHWHDSIFDGDSPRRLPGLFLFALIVLIVIFFLFGRERRSRIYRKIIQRFGRGSGGGGGNLRRKVPFFRGKIPFFSRRGPAVSYERVLEEGDHRDFELGSMDSDEDSQSSSSPPPGITGARRTPHLQSPKYNFDNSSSLSLASISNCMDRRGLVIRTESRERLYSPALAPTTIGRKSRATSPTRHSTPLTNS
ncbi:Golgi apyrase [Microsporum audouinii]